MSIFRLADRQPPMAKPSKPISTSPASDSSRRSSYMPPWTIPNSALRCPAGRAAGASARPAQRQAHRCGRFGVGGRVGRAFVKDHGDVGVEHVLDAHRLLGSQEKAVAIDRRLELDALLADLAQRAERKDLKATRIGEYGAVPAHEAVQSAMRSDDLQTWPQPEVEGVAQADLRAGFDQVARGHRLDRSVGADRHEGGGFDQLPWARVMRPRRAAPSLARSSKFICAGGLRVEDRGEHPCRAAAVGSGARATGRLKRPLGSISRHPGVPQLARLPM
jgi:hypothetical protein